MAWKGDRPIAERFAAAVSDLYPGYFALVMATGIISIAAHLLQMPFVAEALYWVNRVVFPVLWLLTLGRLIFYFPRLLDDLTSHTRGPGFFTAIAGTCVFGTQILVLTGRSALPWGLWWLAVGLWLVVMYTFFSAVTIRTQKPPLETGINGAWLIAIVATQSIAILATLLLAGQSDPSPAGFFFATCMFLLGCMLYLSIITLIFYRFTFLEISTAMLTPPYWINMGAVAITTLAGANLILNADRWSFLVEILPFLKGFTLFFWATGTWWIPLLFILGAWRHLVKRHPLTYDPQYWGMVFPLGMYTACTIRLSAALNLPFLMAIPRLFIYIAFVAWAAVFLGMVAHLAGIRHTRTRS